MIQKKLIFFIFSIFFSFFVIFSYLVGQDYFDKFDLQTLIFIQKITPVSLDTWFSFFSLLGSFEVTFILLTAFLFFGKKRKIIMILGVFFVIHLIEILGKTFLHHLPPPHEFSRYNLPWFFLSSYVKPGFAYPSGHAMRTIFIFIIMFFSVYFSKTLKSKTKLVFFSLFFLIVLIMFYSRISLGEHWPTDVIGGFFLGLSAGIFSLLFL